jgi:hypothetical protein
MLKASNYVSRKNRICLVCSFEASRRFGTALSNSDDHAISHSLWSASAETEYAVFLLSLMLGSKAEDASWKHSSLTKQLAEFKPAMNTAFELLKNAQESLKTGSTEKSHEEAWAARNLLLKAQGLLERKHKEARK